MNNYKTFLAALVVGLTGFVTNASSELLPTTLNSVVKVSIGQDDGSCSGVTLSSTRDAQTNEVTTRILTAKHCVKDKKFGFIPIKKFDKEGRLLSETRIGYDLERQDTQSDLAIITLRDKENVYPVSTVAQEQKVFEGDKVFVIGYPAGLARLMTDGYLATQFVVPERGEDFGEPLHNVFVASPDIFYGNSGGGLYQMIDNNYELIGITSIKHNQMDHFGGYVGLEDINRFVDKSNTQFQITIPWPNYLPF